MPTAADLIPVMAARLRVEISKCGCPVPAECAACRERERLILSAGPWITLEQATTIEGRVVRRGIEIRRGVDVPVSAALLALTARCRNCRGVGDQHERWCTAIPLEERVLPLVPTERCALEYS